MKSRMKKLLFVISLVSGAMLLFSPGNLSAQSPATLPAAEKPKEDATKEPFKPEPFSFHFQSTATLQGYPAFHAAYSGPNSLPNFGEGRMSYSSTLFLGAKLWEGAEIYANPELFGGKGIGQGFGIAGFTNGDVNRVSTSHPSLYLARAFLRQNVGFGGEKEDIPADQNQLATTLDVSRLTLTLGKFSAADIFDGNAYAHDPRTQFLNWTLFDNGAWDYPADIRGYTLGGALELNQKNWALRYGIFLEASVASGAHLDYHEGNAFGQAVEYEQRYEIATHPGRLRLMAFLNRAHMGSYTEAAQSPPPPDVTRSRRYSLKYGFGINLEQQLTEDSGLFARFGWNDGRREDWSFTEIDRTASLGLSVKGARWGRPDDTFGLAGAVNGISDSHRRYLSAGGTGFIIGDGKLSYDLEEIAETYYSAKLFKYVFVTGDVQVINHPAYNRDRGPVFVGTIRLRVQF